MYGIHTENMTKLNLYMLHTKNKFCYKKIDCLYLLVKQIFSTIIISKGLLNKRRMNERTKLSKDIDIIFHILVFKKILNVLNFSLCRELPSGLILTRGAWHTSSVCNRN